jgi:hypothetical protein
MLLRSGTTAAANVQSFALGSFREHSEYDTAIEYYNAALGHYFMTASASDFEAIESGRITGWQATGYSLGVLTVPIASYCCSMWGNVAVPVCRFYIPPAQGDSHFFSAIAQECTDVATNWRSLEAADFFVACRTRTPVHVPWPPPVSV